MLSFYNFVNKEKRIQGKNTDNKDIENQKRVAYITKSSINLDKLSYVGEQEIL